MSNSKRKINTSLLSQKEKLNFMNLLKPSSSQKIKKPLFPEVKIHDSSPSSLTSRNFTNSFYEKKNLENEFFKKSNQSKPKNPQPNFSEFFTLSDFKKITKKAPVKPSRSVCKSEEIFPQNEKDNFFDKSVFDNKIKEKFLKVVSLKNEFRLFNFNDKNLQNLISHNYNLGIILIEKALHRATLFQEDEHIFNNVYEIIQQFFEILSIFQKIYQKISEENNDKSEKIQILSEDLKKLQLEKERTEMPKLNVNSLAFKSVFKNSAQDPNIVNYVNSLQNTFELEKQKLLSENEQLRALVQANENEEKLGLLSNEFKSLKEKFSTKINDLKSEKSIMANKIVNLEFTSQNQKSVIKLCEQEIQTLKEKLANETEEKEKLEKENVKFSEKDRISFEIISMQYEEILSIKLRIQDNMGIIKKVKENYFNIQSKLNSLTKMNELPKSEDFQVNFNLLSEVSQYFQSQKFCKGYKKIMPTINDPEESEENSSQNFKKAENLDMIHNMDITKYHYYQPTFYSFIENKYKNFEIKKGDQSQTNPLLVISETIQSEKAELDGEFLLNTNFISLIRGILDSKWNEFMFYENIMYYSKFPEFVYSWLGKFEIDNDTRTIVPFGNQDPDEERCHFLKKLIHPIIDKHWESITFREFLEEKSSLDELYFYLYCRFLLFKGQQLSHSQGKFCFVHFINFEIVNEVIDIVFKNFEEENLSFLKKKLKSKAKVKNSHILVDSGFVLRVFLEYYRLERKHRFKLLQELFLIKAQNKMNVKYEEFKNIIEAFQVSISDIDKARMFRECYNLGHGKIDPEILFLVLTENNFFIYTIKTRFHENIAVENLKKLGSQNFNNGNNPETDTTETNEDKIFNNFANLEKKICEIHNIVGTLGIENLLLEVQNYIKIFKKQTKFENVSSQKTLIYSYFKFHEILMSVRNYELFMKSHEKIISDDEILKTELFFYENVYNFIYKVKNKEAVIEMELNSKAKKIQKWVQVRFSRWLKLLYTMFKVKMHHKKQTPSVSTLNKSIIKEKKP